MIRNPRAVVKRLILLPGIYQLVAFVRAKRFVVSGESMVPTILPGERVIVDTLAYRFGRRLRAGDVVLARHPERPGLMMLKRVGGIPGNEVGARTLGEDEYWLVGDAPEFSTDSRQLGPVRSGDVIGRAWAVELPGRAE
ncbi:MAG: nickel-type superoxide dismutase maturation protease [Chloroflexi bacterium]|nr:nickel-type superoxide dismutase maturation protease [Chloroflexota bacterium]